MLLLEFAQRPKFDYVNLKISNDKEQLQSKPAMIQNLANNHFIHAMAQKRITQNDVYSSLSFFMSVTYLQSIKRIHLRLLEKLIAQNMRY